MILNNPTMYDCPKLNQMPVSLRYFTESENYIGKSLKCGELLYSYWKDFLYNRCGSNFPPSEIILDGPVAIGKSLISAILASWQLYNILIMSDWKESLSVNKSVITFIFTNETVFGHFREFVCQSDFFREYIKTCSDDKIIFKDDIEAIFTQTDRLLINDDKNSLLGKNIIFADLCAFPGNDNSNDVCIETYKVISARMFTKFNTKGLIVAETNTIYSTRGFRKYIRNLEDSKDCDQFIHICEPQWKIRPKDHYSNEVFKVLYNEREIDIIESLNDLPESDGSYKLINVPTNLLMDFKFDPAGSMQLIAGIDPLNRYIRCNLDFQTVIQYLKSKEQNLVVYRRSKPEVKYTVNGNGNIVRLHNLSRINGFTEESIFANDWVVEFS